jgi:putative endonuclease
MMLNFDLCNATDAYRVTPVGQHCSMAEHNHTGNWGEQLACQWLESKGYTILHRNWRHGRDEIDIVARDNGFLVVVEVKTRSSARWGNPELAVGPAKQRNLMRAADELLFHTPGNLELRFDVISITRTARGPEVFHIPGAFYPTL